MLLMHHILHVRQSFSSCFVPAEAGRLLAGNELSVSTFGTDGQWGKVDNRRKWRYTRAWQGKANSSSKTRHYRRGQSPPPGAGRLPQRCQKGRPRADEKSPAPHKV